MNRHLFGSGFAGLGKMEESSRSRPLGSRPGTANSSDARDSDEGPTRAWTSATPAALVGLFAVLLLIGGTRGVSGQDVVPIGEGCSGCWIAIDTLVVIGDRDGPGRLDNDSYQLRLGPQNRYYVKGEPASLIQVFSADGTYLRSFGREGEGPGEFRWAQALHVGSLGRLFVADRMLGRVTVFGADGTLERTVTVADIAPGFQLFPLPGDSLLLSGYSFHPELVGYSAHVFSPTGERVRSFGDPPHAIVSRDPYHHHRTKALGLHGDLWIAGWDRYLIERWSMEGDRIEAFGLDLGPFADGSPPRPRLNSIQQDSDGLLWVKYSLAVRDAVDRSVDTFVDVIDPSSKLRMASARFSGPSTNLFGGNLLGRPEIDLAGELVRIHVLRLRVMHP